MDFLRGSKEEKCHNFGKGRKEVDKESMVTEEKL